jgi:hypothetical protein
VKKAVGHAGKISTLAESLELHPFPPWTVTSSVTDPDGPAENVMFLVPAPPVIVPFSIDQVYVAPGPASGTEAPFPPELGQTDAGAVISDDGTVLTTALVIAGAEVQAATVAVTL